MPDELDARSPARGPNWGLIIILALVLLVPLAAVIARGAEAPVVASVTAPPAHPAAVPTDAPWRTARSVDGVLRDTLVATWAPIAFGGKVFSSMTYDGRYLPPVLRLRPGDSLDLHLVNQLDDANPTNLHYHGTAISPRRPGDDVLMQVDPASGYDYRIHFPASHDPGLFWYHPHPHGKSEKQVQGGMSGLLVVEGFLERYYPWLANVPEQLVMLKDIEPPGHPDSLGHVKNINGSTDATFRIRPGELQFWRLANIAADGYFNLKLDGTRVWLLASDADPLRRPRLVDSLYLPPGARAEVIVEGGAPGAHAIRHLNVDTGPAGDPNPATRLGTLRVEGEPVDRAADVARLTGMTAIPAVTADLATLRTRPVTRRRTFTFSETADGNTFFINRRQFDMRRVDTRVKVGDVEEWTLVNVTKEVHAFHIHQLDFLVTARDGVPVEADSRNDTVNLPYVGSRGTPRSVTIRVPFTDPEIVGRFVYHCHILEHEDGGMMQLVQVDPATGARPPVAATSHTGHGGMR